MTARLLTASQGGTATELTGLAGWVADVIAALGPVGVGLLVALENIFPPIPSEVVLPFAGFNAGQAGTSVWVMVAASTAGSVGGAIVLYELGRRIGQERTRGLLCRLPLVEPDEVDRAIAWFARHGDGAVLSGRFVPVVRSLISLPAGASEMPRVRFVLLSTLGTAAWNTIWVWGGYTVGSQWRDIARYSDWLNSAFWAVVALLLVRFIWKRRHRLPGLS